MFNVNVIRCMLLCYILYIHRVCETRPNNSIYFPLAIIATTVKPDCKTDCDRIGRHPECCSDDNLGKFLGVENNPFTIRYFVCPVTKPDYCA